MIGEILAKQKMAYEEKEEYIKALRKRIKGEVAENKKFRKLVEGVIGLLQEALRTETFEQGESLRYGKVENMVREEMGR